MNNYKFFKWLHYTYFIFNLKKKSWLTLGQQATGTHYAWMPRILSFHPCWQRLQNLETFVTELCNKPKAPAFLSAEKAILWGYLGFSSMIDLDMYILDSLWWHGYRMFTALQLDFCSASNNSSCGYYAFIFQALFSTVFFTFTLRW